MHKDVYLSVDAIRPSRTSAVVEMTFTSFASAKYSLTASVPSTLWTREDIIFMRRLQAGKHFFFERIKIQRAQKIRILAQKMPKMPVAMVWDGSGCENELWRERRGSSGGCDGGEGVRWNAEEWKFMGIIRICDKRKK